MLTRVPSSCPIRICAFAIRCVRLARGREEVALAIVASLVQEYPWGGFKSFFHNPETNALPDGYETEDPHGKH